METGLMKKTAKSQLSSDVCRIWIFFRIKKQLKMLLI
jgi:hypothetical protein